MSLIDDHLDSTEWGKGVCIQIVPQNKECSLPAKPLGSEEESYQAFVVLGWSKARLTPHSSIIGRFSKPPRDGETISCQ